MARPEIVCLCGSTKFPEAFTKAMREFTLAGDIVLTVGIFGHQEGLDMNGPAKKMLDELHLRKIDLADYIFVLNVNGYIGESCRNEIRYAQSLQKSVQYLETDHDYVGREF